MKRFRMFWFGLLALAIVVSLALPAIAADAKGRLKSIENEKNTFVMTDNDSKDWTMHLAKEGKVFINDKESKLSDLKAGDEVDVTYDKEGDRLTATVLRCTRK
jgi:outer membrane lipoprotein-sorting protein